MHTTEEKTHENSSKAAAGNVPGKQNQYAAAKQSGAYDEMANSSHHVKQLRFYQSIADSASLKTVQLIGNSEDAILQGNFEALQSIENNSTQNSNDEVIQLAPADWLVNADIARMLGHPHGYFSTWKVIKEKINAYKVIVAGRNTLNTRRVLLNEIWELIDEWMADSKHTAASTEQRVIDIRADIPILRVLVRDESLEVRNTVEDNYVEDYFNTGVQPTAGIPPELTAGLTGLSDAAKATRIFQNINAFRFRYTGRGIPARVAFSARQGDCGTLVLMYMAVAEAAGIPNDRDFISDRLLVPPGPIHGRTATGNTEGETDWYFHNHHWAIGNGVAYDLLFMVSPPQAHVAYTAMRTHNGVNYYLFADGRVVIEPLQAQLTHQIQGKGRVFADELTAQNFIDANHV